jgi:hypothetical protein
MPVPRNTSYARLGVGPEATAEEIQVASSQYLARLKQEHASDDQLKAASALKSLARADERARYDADHPPLSLLRLEPTWSSFVENRAEGLALLRRELEEFLASRGAEVYYPSDLTRTNFTDDFAYSPILDES